MNDEHCLDIIHQLISKGYFIEYKIVVKQDQFLFENGIKPQYIYLITLRDSVRLLYKAWSDSLMAGFKEAFKKVEQYENN